jgi:hypothetical protein
MQKLQRLHLQSRNCISAAQLVKTSQTLQNLMLSFLLLFQLLESSLSISASLISSSASSSRCSLGNWNTSGSCSAWTPCGDCHFFSVLSFWPCHFCLPKFLNSNHHYSVIFLPFVCHFFCCILPVIVLSFFCHFLLVFNISNCFLISSLFIFFPRVWPMSHCGSVLTWA